MTMLDRIAEALLAANRRYGLVQDANGWFLGDLDAGAIIARGSENECRAEAVRLAARAAVEVMREPIEAMELAGYSTWRHDSLPDAGECYRAMIDVILSERPSTAGLS